MRVSGIHRLAAGDNAALCAAMWRAHGLGVEPIEGGVACVGAPPRFYPNVVTTDPAVDPGRQATVIVARADGLSGGFSVKDSYRVLELDRFGFTPLFEARWIHRPAGLAAGAARLDWRRVVDADAALAWETAWSGGSDAPTLFRPAFVASPGVTLLAGWADGAIRAGCVVTAMGPAAGLSNVFGDANEAIGAAAAAVPGLDLVGYESGDALTAALAAGFRTVGDLVVWERR